MMPDEPAIHKLPSGPTVSPSAPWGSEKLVTTPAGVIWLRACPPVNQRLPSGPAMMKTVLRLGCAKVVKLPVGVRRPIVWATASVNQRLPSGPAAIVQG